MKKCVIHIPFKWGKGILKKRKKLVKIKLTFDGVSEKKIRVGEWDFGEQKFFSRLISLDP